MAVVVRDGRHFTGAEITYTFAKWHETEEHRDSLVNRKETRRHQSLGGFEISDSRFDIAHEEECFAMTGTLKSALNYLTAKQRFVLINHAVHKMSFREIGDQLGISKVMAWKSYHAAIKKLKNRLTNSICCGY